MLRVLWFVVWCWPCGLTYSQLGWYPSHLSWHSYRVRYLSYGLWLGAGLLGFQSVRLALCPFVFGLVLYTLLGVLRVLLRRPPSLMA